MVDKSYKLPAIVWLKVTDYMHAWLEYELCGSLCVKNQRVASVQHLPGARDALRMETMEEMMPNHSVGNAMSATWRNALDAGMTFDPEAMEREYGVTKEGLKLFVPIECPKMCLTESGVLRPWTNDVNLGRHQTAALQKVVRNAFWQAVTEFSERYAREHEGEKYAQADMIESFCQETKTPDIYVDAMRREWQRRLKRTK